MTTEEREAQKKRKTRRLAQRRRDWRKAESIRDKSRLVEVRP